jgi:hypothetical protein
MSCSGTGKKNGFAFLRTSPWSPPPYTRPSKLTTGSRNHAGNPAL